MKCPFCGKPNTKVVDSRQVENNTCIRRRRYCEKCKKRFTTFEKVEAIPLVVIKKDQTREFYDRSKIESAIYRSCHKRPVSAEQIDKLIDEIETDIFNLERKEIPSWQIGEIVMNKLRDFDQIGYVRFASVYREFEDINTFVDEIAKILEQNI